jgi:hypothetical protein
VAVHQRSKDLKLTAGVESLLGSRQTVTLDLEDRYPVKKLPYGDWYSYHVRLVRIRRALP